MPIGGAMRGRNAFLVLALWGFPGCASDASDVKEDEQVDRSVELAVPTSGLVGEWKLDGNGNDSSGKGSTLRFFGSPGFVTSKLGSALNLNNATSGIGGKYAEMPSNVRLDDATDGAYTISAWFYPNSVPPDTNTSNDRYAIVVKNNHTMGLLYDSAQKFRSRHYLSGDVLSEVTS